MQNLGSKETVFWEFEICQFKEKRKMIEEEWKNA